MTSLSKNADYKEWISALKNKIRSVQIKAAVQINTELLRFYWELGADIVEKQKQANWGDGLIEQLSRDLSSSFPDMKGFSRRNLMYIQKWYIFYTQEDELVQQAVALITQIPWGHNLVIITKARNMAEALFYIQATIENNWSRNVLTHQIEGDFYISAVDGEVKSDLDNPTIGILICKSRNDTVVEYSLKDINNPIGVSEYRLTKSLPDEFKSSLPSIEEIEAELEAGDEHS